MNKILTVLFLFLFTQYAFAIYKCEDNSGKITYKEAPCGNEQKSENIKIANPSTNIIQSTNNNNQWRFSKEKDPMTGETTCFALSPTAYLVWGRGYHNSAQVYLQIAVPVGKISGILTVRNRTSEQSFHNKLDGMGIKIGDQPFTPLTRRFSTNALGFPTGLPSEILGQFEKSNSFRMRLRFWPYEDLLDTEKISLVGVKDTVLRAMACATE